MRYKTGLVTKLKQDEIYREQQEEIKKKHHIEDEDVVVVEKTNMGKFLIRLMIGIIRFAASAAIILLAAAGLITIIYPQSRQELIDVLYDIFYEIMGMFI